MPRGEPGRGYLPGAAPALGRGRTHRVPAPLSSALSPDSRQARSWAVGPEFRAEPQTSSAGVPGGGSGHGACLGRSLGSGSARPAGGRCPPAPLICFVRPSISPPRARAGTPPPPPRPCRAPRRDRAWGKGGVAPGAACGGACPTLAGVVGLGEALGLPQLGAQVCMEWASSSPCWLPVTLTPGILPRSPSLESGSGRAAAGNGRKTLGTPTPRVLSRKRVPAPSARPPAWLGPRCILVSWRSHPGEPLLTTQGPAEGPQSHWRPHLEPKGMTPGGCPQAEGCLQSELGRCSPDS